MVYLDYSATTKTRDEVLDTYIKSSKDYFANPNSLHKLGVDAKKLIDASTNQIAKIMGCKSEDIIYTSCASESNNLAIKGYALRNKQRGMHIISTNLEHSSIYGPLGYLSNLGFEVDFVKTNSFGLVDIDDLKNLLRDDTILVSIGAVNSETGVRQNIEEIAKLLKNYNCAFHVDATQAVGKVRIDYSDIDLISFTAHKFYGPKGVGVLIKRDNILIEPLIHGGKSTTIYRSGTPALPLITSISKALRLIDEELDDNYKHVLDLNNYIKDNLKKYENVRINSNEYSIPHILNLSVMNAKPESMQHALEEYDIYISTQSACSSNNPVSRSVLEVTKDNEASKHSIRISLSGYTTKEEVDCFLNAFDKCIDKFNSLN
ncbi:MAG: cysteine desulfurase [Bacilli bacterium]|nr:cysteine desulfurase [Bacilli bacterium]